MRALVFVCFLAFFAGWGYGQQAEWTILSTIAVEDLDLASLDNRGNVFYSDRKGNVFQLDPSGTVVNQYSPLLQGRLDQLDAFSTMVLFLFSADLQQVVLLDRHLTPLHTISFQDEAIGLVKAAALGNSNVLWLFDEVDLSLKKYDYRRGEIVQVQPLATLLEGGTLEVAEIQERQNLVFMRIKDQGLLIFDNQGNLIKRHDIQINQKLAVLNDHLYFAKADEVHRLNIYSGKKTVHKLLNLSDKKILMTSGRMAIYSSDSVIIVQPPRSDN